MPRVKNVNPKDLEIMRKMREVGLSCDEISRMFEGEFKGSTIAYYTNNVVIDESKKNEFLKSLRELFMSWSPGTPLEKLPLPKGIIEILKE